MLSIQFTYQLIRSRRRTLGLEITEEGKLIVRAPKRASFREIENLLQEKERWILKHKEDIRQKILTNPPKRFLEGEQFLYLGSHYPLKTLATNDEVFTFNQEGFFITLKALPHAQQYFNRWYYEQAKIMVTARVAIYAARFDLFYQGVRIANPKRRWGSCSPDNKVSFNWRLIMAPQAVIDYVVAHELAHTLHKNHKKRFWQKVEKMVPDYKIHRRWLRDHGHLLTV